MKIMSFQTDGLRAFEIAVGKTYSKLMKTSTIYVNKTKIYL